MRKESLIYTKSLNMHDYAENDNNDEATSGLK